MKDFETTAEIDVPEKIIDQVIGQEKGVELIKKAAKQRRNVFLLGDPGTGKSMLGMAMAELLPSEELVDVLVDENSSDPNKPKVRKVPAGQGKEERQKAMMDSVSSTQNQKLTGMIILIFLLSIPWILLHFNFITEIMAAASLVVGGMIGVGAIIGMQVQKQGKTKEPKVLIDNSDQDHAPFVEATGAKAGALLGDVQHDPLQSGGLGTPPHLRVEAGMIHRAHKGVLFLDEIATLSPKSQQELLTAMQEGEYSITGQSEMSSGAMVHTEPVPCDFVLVAAGNVQDMEKMHPALRSRIRGYGYEVYLNSVMEDTEENQEKIVQFVAQEVEKDGKIPHFSKEGVKEVIKEAKRKADRKNKLTVHLRELGGLVRASGDIAKSKGEDKVKPEHVKAAKKISKTMEEQIAEKYISKKRDYEVFTIEGERTGKVNGLGIMGNGGIIIPIEAEVSAAQSKKKGKTIATGKLGEIAKEAVQNVSALVKKYKGEDISNYDIHIQFLQTYEGVEGDSASVSVATAVLSALEDIKIKQNVAMTGSLSVRGQVLPVGKVTQKAEAAAEAGVKKVLVPESNTEDLSLSEEYEKKIEVVPVKNLYDVLNHALVEGKEKKALLKNIGKVFKD